MTNFDEIRKKIDTMETKSLVAGEMKAFVTLVLSTVNKNKEDLANLSAENLKTIKDSIAFIEENSAKLDNTLKDKINTATGQFDAKLAFLKDLIEEVKTLKPKDGNDGISPLPEEIVPLVLEQIKLPEYKETVLDDGQQIADKLNQFDEVVDQKVIKGLVKKIADISSNIAHNAVKDGAKLYTGTSEARVRELIATTPGIGSAGASAFTDLTDVPSSYTSQALKVVRVNAGETGLEFTTLAGGGTWGSITGTLSAQTDLQSALDAKQGDITLTTTGTSGAATLVGDTLNIPQYAASITGSDTQVLFFDGANNPAGDAGMTYVKATDTLTVAGALVSPLITGGTGTTSDLNFKTTTGVGATGADMHFLVGNNGATEAMTILNSGNVGIGTTTPNTVLHLDKTVQNDTPIFKLTGVGNYGGSPTDSVDGVGIGLIYNASGNRQFWIGDSESGAGIRIIGSHIAGWNYTTDADAGISIGSGSIPVIFPLTGGYIANYGAMMLGSGAGPSAQLHVTVVGAGTIGQIIQAAASQTADLLQFQNDSATVLSRITANGWFNSPGNSRVNSDVTNATATMANITGLSATLVAGRKYAGRIVLYVNDSTAVDGIAMDFDGGTATMTTFRADGQITDTASLLYQQSTALATDYVAATITGDGKIAIDFTIVVNAGGTFIPRIAQNAHTTGTATVYAGSYMIINDVV